MYQWMIFSMVDDELLVSTPMSDDDILLECSNADSDESDNEDLPEVPPHKYTIKEAKAELCSAFAVVFPRIYENVGNNFVNSNRDAQMKQSSIDEYFSRTPTASKGQQLMRKYKWICILKKLCNSKI